MYKVIVIDDETLVRRGRFRRDHCRYEKPVILSDGKLSIGEASASFEGADLLAIETLPITDARLKTAWDHDLYRIRLKGNDASFRLTIQ